MAALESSFFGIHFRMRSFKHPWIMNIQLPNLKSECKKTTLRPRFGACVGIRSRRNINSMSQVTGLMSRKTVHDAWLFLSNSYHDYHDSEGTVSYLSSRLWCPALCIAQRTLTRHDTWSNWALSTVTPPSHFPRLERKTAISKTPWNGMHGF